MAEFKPVKINSDDEKNTTPGAMNVNAETGDITFVWSDGETINKSAAGGAQLATVPDGGFTDEEPPNLADTESLVSPAYLHNVFLWLNKERTPDIIGVVDNGVRNNSGMGLSWIDGDFNIIDELAPDYFDKHPSYQFDDARYYGQYFRRIPICYTRRGYVPSGKPNAGKWYMQLCPEMIDGFEPHYTAFMYKGVLKDCFYWGTYRAFENAGTLGSQPNKPHLKSVSWNTTTAVVAELGDGYHMGSFQEYHEILMRAVIERKTFDLWPASVRKDYQANEYRGIQEMAYDRYTDDSTNGTRSEWRSGVRTDENKQLEVWDTAGNQTYVKSGKTPNIEAYIGSLLTGTYFDHLFFAETGASTIPEGIIPDYNYTTRSSCVGFSYFYSGTNGGVFSSNFSQTASYAHGTIGSRLARSNS